MADAPNEMKNAAAELSKIGVINGRSENTFAPNDKVTRAELAAMLSRALELSGGQSSFADVPADAWYYGSVSAAASAGMIDGFEDGTFKPDGLVTNEQLAAVMVKYLVAVGANTSDAAMPYGDTISEWAQDYVRIAAAFGSTLSYEDNTFRGQEAVTRGDCAVILHRFLWRLGG